MTNYRYEYKDGGRNCKYLPNDLHISILWLGDHYALSGDIYGITNRTWKTLKGAQNYMAKNHPNYKLVGEF